MDSKAFVELVEKELKAQKITKAAFYEATGISSASFSQWRKGMYSPSSANIKSIEEFLKISFHLSTKEKSPTPEGVRLSQARIQKMLGDMTVADLEALLSDVAVEIAKKRGSV